MGCDAGVPVRVSLHIPPFCTSQATALRKQLSQAQVEAAEARRAADEERRRAAEEAESLRAAAARERDDLQERARAGEARARCVGGGQRQDKIG